MVCINLWQLFLYATPGLIGVATFKMLMYLDWPKERKG
jgi:hypothetical protein